MNKESIYNNIFNIVIKNLEKLYGNELILGFRYDEDKEKIQLIYYPKTISFLNEKLLFDLYTQIDEVLIPFGIKKIGIFFDSEKEYIDLNKESVVIEYKSAKTSLNKNYPLSLENKTSTNENDALCA